DGVAQVGHVISSRQKGHCVGRCAGGSKVLGRDPRALRGAELEAAAKGTGIATKDFGTTGAASYAMTLLPGTYDVTYLGNPALCGGGMPSEFPCNSGSLKTGANLAADGVLDIDVPAVKVSGTVTLKGAPFASATMARGAL